MYICMYISLYILGLESAYERTCDLGLFEHGLLCLTCLNPVLPIFMHMPYFILCYHWIILHCVNISNLL
jgi:hypothetical protein